MTLQNHGHFRPQTLPETFDPMMQEHLEDQVRAMYEERLRRQALARRAAVIEMDEAFKDGQYGGSTELNQRILTTD